ncbi:hypothetical protein ACWC9X_01940 [Streptomyces asoensis]
MTTLTEPAAETAPTPSAPQPEQEAAEPMASAEDTAVTTPSATNLLHTLETTAAADRTCKKHEAVRHALMSALFEADEQATSPQAVDVSRTAEDGDFLYEILGAGHSACTDLRTGAARLLEINHTLAAQPTVSTWSSPSRRPKSGPPKLCSLSTVSTSSGAPTTAGPAGTRMPPWARRSRRRHRSRLITLAA